jgi:hypothetical protein
MAPPEPELFASPGPGPPHSTADRVETAASPVVRGHQRSTGLGHGGSRRRRCANIHCSKYSLRSLLYRLFFPDSILLVLVLTCLTTSETGPLHPKPEGP